MTTRHQSMYPNTNRSQSVVLQNPFISPETSERYLRKNSFTRTVQKGSFLFGLSCAFSYLLPIGMLTYYTVHMQYPQLCVAFAFTVLILMAQVTSVFNFKIARIVIGIFNVICAVIMGVSIDRINKEIQICDLYQILVILGSIIFVFAAHSFAGWVLLRGKTVIVPREYYIRKESC